MRLVQVTIPAGKRETVLAALDEEGIDYVVTEETGGEEYSDVAYFPVPTEALEPTLDRLREAGVGENAYTVVLEASTVVSRRFEELQERYAEEEGEDRIAREELTARARELAPSLSNYVLLTVVSAVIATAGLLLDSPAVVVGSMVIAPLVGPAMGTAVGAVVGDRDLFARGVRLQVLGLVLAVTSAAVFAFAVRSVNLIPPLADVTAVPEIAERVSPDFLSLVVALGAGVAGVVSLASGVSTALVGVMIAVALIPPAAVVGIGIAWSAPLVSLGSGVLVLVNVLSINLAALVVLSLEGYSPKRWFRTDEARATTLRLAGALAAAIVVLSLFLGGVTYDSYTGAVTEERIRADVADAVAGAGGDERLLSVAVHSTNAVVFGHPERVVVTVGIPPGDGRPDLAERLDAAADRAAGRDVATEVRYVTVQTAPAVDPPAPPLRSAAPAGPAERRSAAV